MYRASQVALVVKILPDNARDEERCGFDPWVEKIPWRRKWKLTAVFLTGNFHGQRSLAGYSPWAAKSQIRLSTHTHIHI